MNHYHKHPFIFWGRMVFRGSGGDQSSPAKYKGELYRNLTANWIVNQDPPSSRRYIMTAP